MVVSERDSEAGNVYEGRRETNPHAPGVTAFLSKCAELARFEEVVHQALVDSGAEVREHPARDLSPSAREALWKQDLACSLMQ